MAKSEKEGTYIEFRPPCKGVNGSMFKVKDEVIAQGVFVHMERMSEQGIFMSISGDKWGKKFIHKAHRRIEIEEAETPYQPLRRNRRRWCRGKIGVDHDYQAQGFEWRFNSRDNPQRLLHSVWTVCVKCGRKDEYIGLFESGEKWLVRRSRWIGDEKRKRLQDLCDKAQH